MTEPHLHACYFATPKDRTFDRLAAVLEATAAVHCAGWARTVRRIDRRQWDGSRLAQHQANTTKLADWCEAVARVPDGTRLLLADADLAILRPLDDVWDQPFDLAYTVKRHGFPFNLGVMFLRVSPATRAAIGAWWVENLALQRGADPIARDGWRERFGGVNQAAFGRCLEAGRFADLQLLRLACREWNCEESAWPAFHLERTRVLHIKGALRRAIFRQDVITPDIEPLAARWTALEAQALAHVHVQR